MELTYKKPNIRDKPPPLKTKSPSPLTKSKAEIERAIEFEEMKIIIHRRNENRRMILWCEDEIERLKKQL